MTLRIRVFQGIKDGTGTEKLKQMIKMKKGDPNFLLIGAAQYGRHDLVVEAVNMGANKLGSALMRALQFKQHSTALAIIDTYKGRGLTQDDINFASAMIGIKNDLYMAKMFLFRYNVEPGRMLYGAATCGNIAIVQYIIEESERSIPDFDIRGALRLARQYSYPDTPQIIECFENRLSK
jgi:hypothetical protein